jgi:hypothetical protein
LRQDLLGEPRGPIGHWRTPSRSSRSGRGEQDR